MSRLANAERILSATLSIATIVGVGILVEGRLRPATQRVTAARIERIKNWDDISQTSISVISDIPGAVSVAAFTDFECPMCKLTDSLLTVLSARNPTLMARALVPFPLPGHPHAMAAAVAFECARAQGRARAMHEQLYKSTNDFANAPWRRLANAALVPDSMRFAECLESEKSTQRILAGVELGKGLKISGTPAFVINGRLYDAAPFDVIEKAILDAGRNSPITKN